MKFHPLEIEIQDIAKFMLSADRFERPTAWTNKEIKSHFPGERYAKAWKVLKSRGKRNGTLFFEDGKWNYFP